MGDTDITGRGIVNGVIGGLLFWGALAFAVWVLL